MYENLKQKETIPLPGVINTNIKLGVPQKKNSLSLFFYQTSSCTRKSIGFFLARASMVLLRRNQTSLFFPSLNVNKFLIQLSIDFFFWNFLWKLNTKKTMRITSIYFYCLYCFVVNVEMKQFFDSPRAPVSWSPNYGNRKKARIFLFEVIIFKMHELHFLILYLNTFISFCILFIKINETGGAKTCSCLLEFN